MDDQTYESKDLERYLRRNGNARGVASIQDPRTILLLEHERRCSTLQAHHVTMVPCVEFPGPCFYDGRSVSPIYVGRLCSLNNFSSPVSLDVRQHAASPPEATRDFERKQEVNMLYGDDELSCLSDTRADSQMNSLISTEETRNHERKQEIQLICSDELSGPSKSGRADNQMDSPYSQSKSAVVYLNQKVTAKLPAATRANESNQTVQVIYGDDISGQSEAKADGQTNAKSPLPQCEDSAVCRSKENKSKKPEDKRRKQNTNSSSFPCRVCNKVYAHHSSLCIHMRTHTGSKPHRCPYCQKAFNQSGNLKVHVRIHTNERPYSCNYCEKKFKQLSALRSHEYLHIRDEIMLKPSIFSHDT